MKYSELTIHQKINYKNYLLSYTNFNKSKILERILTDEIKILETRINCPFGEILFCGNREEKFIFYEYKKEKKNETN